MIGWNKTRPRVTTPTHYVISVNKATLKLRTKSKQSQSSRLPCLQNCIFWPNYNEINARMPFISQDWRSPGELWIKTDIGWERKKIFECLKRKERLVHCLKCVSPFALTFLLYNLNKEFHVLWMRLFRLICIRLIHREHHQGHFIIIIIPLWQIIHEKYFFVLLSEWFYVSKKKKKWKQARVVYFAFIVFFHLEMHAQEWE